MALTEAEMRRVEQMFDQLDHYEQQKVVSSQQAFVNWLRNTVYSIYCKVRDWLNDLWDWLFG